MRSKGGRGGFTLIEIILVLAIAGLIMLVVFLALVGAQRARRDNHRKQDAARLSAGIIQHVANTNGNGAPTDASTFQVAQNAVFANQIDPLTGIEYAYSYFGANQPHTFPPPPVGSIYYVRAHQCDRSGTVALLYDPPNWSSSLKVFAVLIGLEQGSYYCVDGEF